ncbi:hypothetical protein GF362_01605 [Candidatus Dojkabacteria bacterium]|nr:hypothetical protein [Candidatus Dojkabacteria bacterium]
MDKYLFDKYVASRFLGTRINDPMVSNFMKSVKKIINELISDFLVDYTAIRGYEFELVLEAYEHYYTLFAGDIDIIEKEAEADKDQKIYEILHDTYFYEELEKRINDYFKKMYDKYVPGLTEKAKKELQEYIDQKNRERNEFLDEMIEHLDKDIQEAEAALDNIQIKIDKFRNKIGDSVVVSEKIWNKSEFMPQTRVQIPRSVLVGPKGEEIELPEGVDMNQL